ncbi:MAG: endolytic transglycosylase MltG [Minisyncoccia bacterium]
MENFPSPADFGDLEPKVKRKNVLYALGGIIFIVACYFFFLSAPMGFPRGVTFSVEKGASLQSVSGNLKRENIIRSRVVFEFFVIMLGKEKSLVSADYFFNRKLPVFEIARRIGAGVHSTAPVSVTIPEGFDTKQIGDTFALKLADFNKEEFLIKAKDMEGYLFPDTYFFLTNADEEVVLKSMRSNFTKKLAELVSEISTSGKTEKDIIIMASIVEREAKGDDDREVISGILWKRISIGMPLQADAAPDTYKTKGLPESPVANPGLESIKAAISPESSPFLYYLHDKNGDIHYAKNFIEHKANINKYLR